MVNKTGVNKTGSDFAFLLDTYETELMKITGLWSAFPESSMDFRPHARSRSVIEQMEHQVQSEGRWMKTMLGIDVGDPNPSKHTKEGFVDKYRSDAARRLDLLRTKSDEWWREPLVGEGRACPFRRRDSGDLHSMSR